ncbi:alanyl-tRNA editing protein [Comamonas composti]|uniref:alanyl-tRNA editing protein n=1 Tax=Comamonas composti TaxID=408558 RepID=UPI00040325ED|nr:alanyl-tRNA editing protein [Comamonas composti]
MTVTQDLFREDSYLQQCEAEVVALTEQGIVLDRTVFYPLGGGQAGDSGELERVGDGARCTIVDARKLKNPEDQPTQAVAHVSAPGEPMPLAVGDKVIARIDWGRRHRMMRLHTGTHLLAHLVGAPVNGCSVTAEGARVDFAMSEGLDKELLGQGLAALVAADHEVTVSSISDAELDANPGLVKSMSVQPPRGTGRVRTIRVGGTEAGQGSDAVDYQPCGGTHVLRTGEIGAIVVSKIEKKGAQARRVVVSLAD